MTTHDDLNLLLAGLVLGVAIIGVIAISLASWERRQLRKQMSAASRIHEFWGDQITTNPDVVTTREGRRG